MYLRRLNDDLTEVIASQLHYLAVWPSLSADGITFAEARRVYDGWLDRYRNDPAFRASVMSMTGAVMQVVHKHGALDSRL